MPFLSSHSGRPFYFAPNVLLDQSTGLFLPAESGHQDTPGFWHLVALVSEAVLEVVCVSSLGFIAAKQGLFPAKVQKDVANLNIYFFTPCLIFSKLSSQLDGEKLVELWIIPCILFMQTVISWLSAWLCTRALKLNKQPQRNFVTAMAVFGNSNSLPLSLVISLSHTISGLHWDQVPNDNDDEVSARGILYLLCFSQLGQAVRWSWGMNTLLRPIEEYTPEERGEIPKDEEDAEPYEDDDDDDAYSSDSYEADSIRPGVSPPRSPSPSFDDDNEEWRGSSSGTQTPVESQPNTTASPNTEFSDRNGAVKYRGMPDSPSKPTPEPEAAQPEATETESSGGIISTLKNIPNKIYTSVLNAYRTCVSALTAFGRRVFQSLPVGLQKTLRSMWFWIYLTITRVSGCINVPLAAIIVSVLVGSVPALKAIFYTKGTFVNNTITSAVDQLAGVAVPVILFVLGGNLCKDTIPDDELDTPQTRREKKQMLWSSMACRMVIPFLFMGPFIAVLAKYTPISILDDPIFIIVCYLLCGAPTALQLAQICQVNDVYVPVISQILFQSYVVWIFPTTLVLVMIALEVVKWAQ